MTNEHLPEPDFEWEDDDDENHEPDYWGCYGCNYTCVRRPMGGECPKCTAIMEECHY